VELEAVCGITVRYLCFEVGGQVDDVNGVEGAFLWADTAPNTEPLRDEGNLGFGRDFDTELACPDYRTRLFTFLAAFLAKC